MFIWAYISRESLLRNHVECGPPAFQAVFQSMLTPGEVATIRPTPMTTANQSGVGPRIRIEARSSNFPKFVHNLNTGAICPRPIGAAEQACGLSGSSAQLYQQLANLRHARAAITARLHAGCHAGNVRQPMLVNGGADRVAADAKA